MDIKSILRVFRFGELQARADRDPQAKRPPTIMFLGLVVALGLAVAGAAMILRNAPADGAAASTLEATDPLPTNATAQPPTPDSHNAATVSSTSTPWMLASARSDFDAKV